VSALGLVVAELPALPLHTAGKYVAAAYIVLFLVVLIYVAIMGIRLSHLERDLGELLSLSASSPEGEHPAEPTPDTGASREAQLSDTQRESTPA
jgi:hypothetical protein